MDELRSRTGRRWVAAGAALGLAAALAVGCGPGDGDPTGPAEPALTDPPATAPPGDQAPEVVVTMPEAGATVTVPFEVRVDSSVELGAIDDELHHLHIWFGDPSGQPLIVESGTATVEDAPDGDTTMVVQVHTFDHQPASDQVSVPLVVQGGSGGQTPGPPPGNDY
jgi:hypothetical protein